MDDFPDCAVGDVVVFVDYAVAEADDCLVAGDLFGDGLVVVGESSGGFADDFELAFDGGGGKGSCRRLRAISRPPRASPASVASLARVPFAKRRGGTCYTS